MSTIKPTGFPAWSTASSSSGIVEPTDTKKQIGWQTSERPAAQYMNWLQEKQSAWIRFLSYDRVIEDDFVRSPTTSVVTTPSGQSSTGFAPTWGVTGGYVNFQSCDSDNTPFTGNGVVEFHGSYSGLVNMETQIVGPGSDFLMEWIVKRKAGGGSGGFFVMGMYPVPNTTGPGCWWNCTGQSGVWFLNYGYSQNPSSINTGVLNNQGPAAFTSTGMFQTFIVERLGATLTAQIDGQQVAAIGAVNATLMSIMNFGLKTVNTTGTSQFFVDKAMFGVRRA